MSTETPPWHHAWRNEPREVTEARYVSMATDIVTVAAEAPIEGDVAWTALLLAETAVAESALRADVDDCTTPGHGGLVPAWSAFGLAVPRAAVCPNRRSAARLAREYLRKSFVTCARRPMRERLAWYLSGHCDRGVGQAKYRWWRMQQWLDASPVPEQAGLL